MESTQCSIKHNLMNCWILYVYKNFPLTSLDHMFFLTWKVKREDRYILLYVADVYCTIKDFSVHSLEFSSCQWNCFKFQVNMFNSCFCDTFLVKLLRLIWPENCYRILRDIWDDNNLYEGKPIAICILKSSPHRNFLKLLKLNMQHWLRTLPWGTSGVIPKLLCSNELLPLCKKKTTSGESFLEIEGGLVN